MVIDLALIRQRIASTSLARQLPEPIRQRFVLALLGSGNTLQAENGTVLFTEGEKSSELAYILLDGMAAIDKSNSPPLTVEAPDLFGEMQQLNPDGVRTATVKVQGKALLLRFDWNDFFALALNLFDEQEMATLRRALEDLAWSHVV